MNIKIYIVGEKIEKNLLEGIKEYQKRLSRYCKITFLQFKNVEQLERKLNVNSYKVLVSVKNETLTSEELSFKINQFGVTGRSDVTFMIGPNSLPHDEVLAFSPMQMDLGIKTLILFEQIYRSYRILNNEPYHK